MNLINCSYLNQIAFLPVYFLFLPLNNSFLPFILESTSFFFLSAEPSTTFFYPKSDLEFIKLFMKMSDGLFLIISFFCSLFSTFFVSLYDSDSFTSYFFWSFEWFCERCSISWFNSFSSSTFYLLLLFSYLLNMLSMSIIA